MKFELLATDGRARRGRLEFPRGNVDTPAFMPVGTYGTVKAMTPEELTGLGAQIILGNTFHLMLRPGAAVIRAHGGLHQFMNWSGPILTDSGGFQVFSLAGRRRLSEEGVHFRSPVDGSEVFLSPEVSMQTQRDLGADIAMVFDECTPYPASEREARESMEFSLRWAARSRAAYDAATLPGSLFGIVQGGVHERLRAASVEGLLAIGFDGYAVGGLAVGESAEERTAVLEHTVPRLPAHRPRYLMGVGRPEDIVVAVERGSRSVRLRDANAPCPQRPPLHFDGRRQHPQQRLSRGPATARRGLRLLHLLPLQSRVPAAPGPGGRNPGFAPQYHSQPVLLSAPDG